MKSKTPRLRMFAGPNGSGKSTIYSAISPELMGGHTVPKDKIISRYWKSLDLLMEAIRFTNRAYIFDNSGHDKIWIAEITNGQSLEMNTDRMPVWFKNALWDKFNEAVVTNLTK